MSRHRSRWYAGAMSLALASFALTSVSPAQADDPSPAKGKAAAPAFAPPASKCSLRPSGHASTHNEWLSCLSVTASLDRLPAVGQTATLTVAVDAADTLTAEVSVELPAGMVWVQAPTGMGSAAKASTRPEDKGTTSKASAKRAMAAGQRATYTGIVKATAPEIAFDFEITADKPIVCICRSGNRSTTACDLLARQGFTQLRNVRGGMIAWARVGYPIEH